MQQAIEESGIRTICDVTDESINELFEVIDWGQVLAGFGITLAGAGVALISGAMLVGVAPLVVPAVLALAAGVGIMDALLVIGTALAALIGTIFGLSDVIEGAQTTYHGTKKDGKVALNIVRDTLFSNNPDDYYFIEFMATAGAAEGLRRIRQFGIDTRIVNNYVGLTADEMATVEGSGTGQLREDFFEIYTPDGKKYVDLKKLPGKDGFQIPRRLTTEEMTYLTEEYEVEFAQVYNLGPGKNGGGGYYTLYSGDISSVSIAPSLSPDAILINHTHPGGTAWPSSQDMNLLEELKRLGSPQNVSEIIPIGKENTVHFDVNGLRQEWR